MTWTNKGNRNMNNKDDINTTFRIIYQGWSVVDYPIGINLSAKRFYETLYFEKDASRHSLMLS